VVWVQAVSELKMMKEGTGNQQVAIQQGAIELRAAIHIGASSISMLVTSAAEGSEGEQIEYLEKSTSLAHDIFRNEEISKPTIERCVETVNGYLAVLLELGVQADHPSIRIVASNIVAEASNKNIFTNRLLIGCGVPVEVLDDGEMTRLIYLKTRRRLHDTPVMLKRNTLVVHAGPGTTRVLYFQKGKIASYNSYRIGTSRVGEEARDGFDDSRKVQKVMREEIHTHLETLLEDYAEEDVQEVVLIGYEIQLMSQHIPGLKDSRCSVENLDHFCDAFARLDDDTAVAKFHLRYRTTESILPALLINLCIAQALNLEAVHISASDYERGLLLDLHQSETASNDFSEEVGGSAWALAKKFRVNKKHAKNVSRLALKLFDDLQELHLLGEHDRLLLHCAALLHESGGFISQVAHHKHSQYLILHSDIFGLSSSDISLVALLTRYHRNSPPKQNHALYRDLDTAQQIRVSKIASLLRIADALERTHSGRISDFDIRITKKKMHLHLHGITDASVERLAMRSKGNLFQNIFGLEINLEEER